MLALLWLRASYTTMACTLGAGSIAFQCWRDASPAAEADLAALNKNVDKIKKRARRMTMGAGDLLRTATMKKSA